MPKKIVELNVDEISSVDKPANKRKFLMIKRDDEAEGEMMDLKTFIESQAVEKEEAESVIAAFYQNVNKIISNADAEAREKLSLIQRSAGQLVNFLQNATTSLKNKSDTKNGGDNMEDLLKSIEDEELREQLEEKFESLQSEVDELKSDDSGDEGDDGEEGDDVKKSEMSEEMKLHLEKMEDELATYKEMAKKERRARRRTELTKKAEDYAPVGETEEIVDVLMKLDEEDEELFEKVEKLLETAANRLKEADLFKESGDSGSDITSSEEELNKKAKKLQEADPDLTFEKAFAKAARSNPKLYSEYKETR